MPDMIEQFRYYARHVADEIAAGEIEPMAAAEHIAELLQKAYDGDDRAIALMIEAAVE